MEKPVKPLWPEIMTSDQCRKYLGDISESCLRNLRKKGLLTPASVGHSYRWRRSDVDAFMANSIAANKSKVDAATTCEIAETLELRPSV